MKNYKYLDDLGVEKKDQYQNWFATTNRDRRQAEWKEQRKIYGIDERSTWNWNSEFMDYCYIHLKMYNEVNNVKLEYHKLEYDGKMYNVQEAIDEILEWFEKEYYPDRGERIWDGHPTQEEVIARTKEFDDKLHRELHLLVEIMPYLWW